MADDPGILSYIGIKVSAFFSGTAGGLVGVLFDDKASFRVWCTYAIGGGLVANFLLEDATQVIPHISNGGLGFGLGVVSPIVVGTIKAAAKKWRGPSLGGGT